MTSSALERAVGLFVLGGLVCLSFFAFRLGRRELSSSETYSLEARFSSVAGLTPGAQILLAGVPVGTVGRLKLGGDFSALVELRIRKDLRLPSDTMASVRSRGLLGDQYVALTPGAEDRALSAGDRITDTEPALDLMQLLGKFAFGSVGAEKKGGNAAGEKTPTGAKPDARPDQP
jgi:phospholipid/cholesterol/gamma-HCH transport system substrate-binding protein